MTLEQQVTEKRKAKLEKQGWTLFITSADIVGAYRKHEDGEYRLKVISSMPRSYYYSAVNNIGEHFDKFIAP